MKNNDLEWRSWLSTGVSKGWLPVEIGGRYRTVRWIRASTCLLEEPFYHQTIKHLRDTSPPPREFETSIDELIDALSDVVPERPRGIIISMSRCGSTLALRALGTIASTTAIGEAQPLDRALVFLRSPLRDEAVVGQRLLEALTTVLSTYLDGEKRPVLMKCAPDAALSLRRLRCIWPDVPCLILIRDPIEVLVSNVLRPPTWLDYIEVLYGRMPTAVARSSSSERMAWAIGRACEGMIEGLDEKCLVVDYADLDAGVITDIGRHLMMTPSPESHHRLNEVFARDAKHPGKSFEPDSAKKRLQANVEIAGNVERWITPSYVRLKKHITEPIGSNLSRSNSDARA